MFRQVFPSSPKVTVVANVLIPAFWAVHFSAFLLLPLTLLVISAEAYVLWLANKAAPARNAWTAAIVMNIVSAGAGILLTPLLVVGDGYAFEPERGFSVRTHEWTMLARWGFLQAAVISFVLEWAVVAPFRRRAKFEQLVRPLAVGNTVSYAVLFGAAVVFGLT